MATSDLLCTLQSKIISSKLQSQDIPPYVTLPHAASSLLSLVRYLEMAILSSNISSHIIHIYGTTIATAAAAPVSSSPSSSVAPASWVE